MTDDEPSRTALTAALMRAIHRRVDDAPLLDDSWGDRLVSAEEKTALYQRILARLPPERRAAAERAGAESRVLERALRGHPTYGGVILRSRYAEDCLAAAVARGIRQYVLLGAGFDSFLVRQPAFARGLRIIEVDHPATQQAKRARLAACGIAVASNVEFLACDLSREPLGAALARSGFDATVPAFCSWLGVSIYLTRGANETTLAAIASSFASGSELVFTYLDQRAFDGDALDGLHDGPAATGEPWLSGFTPAALADDLRRLGWELLEDLDGAALNARYCAGRSDGLAASALGHVAHARVR